MTEQIPRWATRLIERAHHWHFFAYWSPMYQRVDVYASKEAPEPFFQVREYDVFTSRDGSDFYRAMENLRALGVSFHLPRVRPEEPECWGCELGVPIVNHEHHETFAPWIEYWGPCAKEAVRGPVVRSPQDAKIEFVNAATKAWSK